MKHLKRFESFEEEKFDLGKYPVEEVRPGEECAPCEDEEEMPGGEWEEEESEEEEGWEGEEELGEEEHEMRRRVWGDEQTVERVVSFRQFEAKKAKPDFLDLDKDGDKKESMKKAAKDAKEDKKDNKKEDKKDNKKEDKEDKKEVKGLSAAQKKLPAGLQKAIAAKKK